MAIYRSKILAIAVLIVILALTLTQAVSSAEGLKLSAVRDRGDVGGQVTVTVRAENAAGTEGGQFLLTFDPNLVKPVSSEAGELVAKAKSNMYMVNMEYAPGQLMVLWVTPYADTLDSGVVCKIIFDLLKAGETALDFREIIVAPDGIDPATAVSGKITVSRSAEAAETEDNGEESDSEQEVDSSEDLINEQDDNDQFIDNNDQTVNEAGNAASYAIWLVVLVFAVTIGYFIFNRLKKPKVNK